VELPVLIVETPEYVTRCWPTSTVPLAPYHDASLMGIVVPPTETSLSAFAPPPRAVTRVATCDRSVRWTMFRMPRGIACVIAAAASVSTRKACTSRE
jgi:hypothetical protein